MTIKEAVLKVLEDDIRFFTYLEVYEKIKEKNYYTWVGAATPRNTVCSKLTGFIKNNDSRVKRVKVGKELKYYLAKYESKLNFSEVVEKESDSKRSVYKKYQEKDLHKLLSSYLKNQEIYSKTIHHEKSAKSRDNNQKWTHPDMLGVKFLSLESPASNSLLKEVNKSDAFNLISYELKRKIESDYELKKCFFQAVSNSSWANYGYLVAFEISKNLLDEMERLNQSFGIGVIELKRNPYESKILFQPKFKELDFKTVDKLCKINPKFTKFIENVKNILAAEETYLEATKKQFESFCDDCLEKDSEVEKYCKEKNIPIEKEEKME